MKLETETLLREMLARWRVLTLECQPPMTQKAYEDRVAGGLLTVQRRTGDASIWSLEAQQQVRRLANEVCREMGWPEYESSPWPTEDVAREMSRRVGVVT